MNEEFGSNLNKCQSNKPLKELREKILTLDHIISFLTLKKASHTQQTKDTYRTKG